MAKWIHRELQLAIQGRVPQPPTALHSDRGTRRPRGLALEIQPSETPSKPRLYDTAALRTTRNQRTNQSYPVLGLRSGFALPATQH